MLDHISYPVSSYAKSLEWYQQALKPLGYKAKVQIEHEGTQIAGLGDETYAEASDFWIWQGKEGEHHFGKQFHIAFRATSHEAVQEFYKAALAAGGSDNGPPGPRAHYHPAYYGAFVYDLDGNNVEVVCHDPEAMAKLKAAEQ